MAEPHVTAATNPISEKNSVLEMCKSYKKRKKTIWVKYELYYISNLNDLGLANEHLGFTMRGRATKAAEREKCVSYTTFHLHRGKKSEREGQRRGRLLATEHRNLRARIRETGRKT